MKVRSLADGLETYLKVTKISLKLTRPWATQRLLNLFATAPGTPKKGGLYALSPYKVTSTQGRTKGTYLDTMQHQPCPRPLRSDNPASKVACEAHKAGNPQS